MLARKEREFNDSLAKSRGVIVDALSNTEIVTPGESVDVTTNVFIGRPSPGENGSNAASPKIQLVAPPAGGSNRFRPKRSGPRASRRSFADARRPMLSLVPRHGPRQRTTDTTVLVSQTARERSIRLGLFDAAQSAVRARARSREGRLTLNGERVVIEQPAEYRFADKTFGEIRREVKIAPALTLTVHPSLLIVPAGDASRAREISVEITHNARRATNGAVKLVAPPGLEVEADDRPLAFTRQNEKKTARSFKVSRRPARPAPSI